MVYLFSGIRLLGLFITGLFRVDDLENVRLAESGRVLVAPRRLVLDSK